MQIHSVSVDEQNHKYLVTLESGEQFHGVKAMDQIMLEKAVGKTKDGKDKDVFLPVLDKWARKYLRKLKEDYSKRKNDQRTKR